MEGNLTYEPDKLTPLFPLLPKKEPKKSPVSNQTCTRNLRHGTSRNMWSTIYNYYSAVSSLHPFSACVELEQLAWNIVLYVVI
jgi:hypothetical protein